MKINLGAALALVFVPFSLVAADANAFKVGAAKVDITPTHPVRLAGYGNRTTEATAVAEPIFTRAVLIESASQPPAVLVNVESCGVAESFTNRVSEELKKRFNIPRENLVVCVTHTHSAPLLLDYLPNIAPAPLTEPEIAHCRQYEEFLFSKVLEAVQEAFDSRKPARLLRAEGKVDFAVNRRLIQTGQWKGFGVQEGGPVDHRLPILVAKAVDDDKPIAIISNYACHCTTLGGLFNKISGDWAGFAQTGVEARFPGAVGMTVIGCGADANPKVTDPLGQNGTPRVHGEKLVAEVTRLVETELQPVAGALQCKLTHVELPLDKPPTKEQFADRAKQAAHNGLHARYFLDMLERGEPLPMTVNEPVAVWTFGDDLAMVFLGGEVVVDYSRIFSEMFDAKRLWITAYANAVPCYVPSQRILRERGYEPDASMTYYRWPSRFAPEVESALTGAVQRLMPRAFWGEKLKKDFPEPKSPEESRASIRVPEGLRVELVASEPLIVDPVAFDWGVDGKLWVVEMHDYPNGIAPDPARQHELDARESPPRDILFGGRVKYLEDTNADGVYDKATTFLDHVAFPMGIQCWRGGVLVAAAPEIFYAEDTNGDGKADVRRTLYRGFGEGNQQHRVNGLRWGLDNWMYVGNGDSGGEIVSVGAVIEQKFPLAPPASFHGAVGIGGKVNVAFRDLRIRPDEGWMQSISGMTQFGRERDDWGNWFGNNNTNPMFHYALDDTYLRRNPNLAVSDTRVDMFNPSHAGPVYPISDSLQRFNSPQSANHFTSACGTIVYRDSYLGVEFEGNSFTSEPVHNLISRRVITPHGSTFQATRAPEEQKSEFLASTDQWFRPAMVRGGPDGALWFCDMYRFVIEHPKWIPAEWKNRLNIRAGDNMGRIYRVVRETPPPPDKRGHPLPVLATDSKKPKPADEISTERLVLALDSVSGWQRDTAHRLLVERGDTSSAAALEKMVRESKRPQARLHAFCTLDGLNQLTKDLVVTAMDDPHPGVRRHAVRLAEHFMDDKKLVAAAEKLADDADPFVRMQVAYSLGAASGNSAGDTLARLAIRKEADPQIRNAVYSSLSMANVDVAFLRTISGAEQAPDSVVIELAGHLATLAAPEKVGKLLCQFLFADNENLDATRFKALANALEALDRRKIIWSELPGNGKGWALMVALTRAMKIVENQDAEDEIRLAAIAAVATAFRDEVSPLFLPLLSADESQPIQAAAVAAIGRVGDEKTVLALVERLADATPSIRSQIIATLLQRESGVAAMLDAIESNALPISLFDSLQRDRLLKHPSEAIRARAEKLFAGSMNTDRAAVVAQFQPALQLSGNASTGRAAFEKRCAACHQLHGVGKQIAADLAGVKDKSPAALSVAILDPNRAVEAKFLNYVVLMNDGRVLSGMISNETDNGVTLVEATGKQLEILRKDIEQIQNSGKSFMPEGLEKDMSHLELADIMAFVAWPPAAVTASAASAK